MLMLYLFISNKYFKIINEFFFFFQLRNKLKRNYIYFIFIGPYSELNLAYSCLLANNYLP